MGANMIDWPVTLEFTKAVFAFAGEAAWPTAAAVIALKFKAPITAAIERARRVSAFGVEAELPAPAQGENVAGGPPALPSSVPKILTVSPLPPADVLLEPVDRFFRHHLEMEDLTPEQRLAWAIRLASIQAMLARHERNYRVIYGSQIAFLKQLNLVETMSVRDAEAFFLAHRAPLVDSPTYTFEAWLRFLRAQEDVHVDDAAGTVEITPAGRAFLIWMAANSASEFKPY